MANQKKASRTGYTSSAGNTAKMIDSASSKRAASYSRALACLETVVHLSSGDPLPLNRYLVEVKIPIGLWSARTRFDPAPHIGWDAEPAGKVSIDWGTSWVEGKASVLAEVPSVIVPEEHNTLINPTHPDGVKLIAKKIRKWTYDTASSEVGDRRYG